MLAPATRVKSARKQYTDFDYLANTVNDQRAFGGIMNVGFDYERIGPHFLSRSRGNLMTCVDDQVADFLNRLWLEQRVVILNTSPVEIDVRRSEISNAIVRCRIFEENFVGSSVIEARAGAIVE